MFESRRPDPTPSTVTAASVRLVVGNRRTSTWSIAAWLALNQAGLDFDVEEIDLFAPDRGVRVARVSPNARLPVLIAGETTIWDSLAIMEWAAEQSPALWPSHATKRAVARSIVAEVHAGFTSLSGHLPLDWFARYTLKEKLPASAQVDMHRLTQLWRSQLDDDGARPFLFGPRPVLADLVMVPIAARLRAYGLTPRDDRLSAYAEQLLALDALALWFEGVPPQPGLPAPPPVVRTAGPATAPVPNGKSGQGGPPDSEPATRRLEDVVARARLRERLAAPPDATEAPLPPPLEPPTPPPMTPSPPSAAPPVEPPIVRTAPKVEAPSPPARALPRTAMPRDGSPHEADPSPSTPRGLPWLRQRRRAPLTETEPPGGGSRRRPPPRR